MKQPVPLTPAEAIALVGLAHYPDYAFFALHRPGSREWQEERAALLRGDLSAQGYSYLRDAAAPWHVYWVVSPL